MWSRKTFPKISSDAVIRFITITGEVVEWKAIAPKASGWERFARQVKEIQSHYDDCQLECTNESADLWTEFYIKWKTSRQKWNERDRKLTGRIDEHILKLAMVYVAIEKQSVLTCDALVTALLIGKWLQATTLKAFGDVGKDSFGRGKEVVLGLRKFKNAST